jgi:hypothetical protein
MVAPAIRPCTSHEPVVLVLEPKKEGEEDMVDVGVMVEWLSEKWRVW